MKKFVFVYWFGDLCIGIGSIFIEIGVLCDVFYGFILCFEDGFGINLEELLGVVYVVCFLMVFLLGLGEVGFIVDSIDIKVVVMLDKDGDGFVIIVVYLICWVDVFGVDVVMFECVVQVIKIGCLVLKVFKVIIMLDVVLEL